MEHMEEKINQETREKIRENAATTGKKAARKKKSTGRRILGSIFMTALLLGGLGAAFHVTPKTGYRTVEMGEPISHVPENYLEGFPFAVQLGKVDLSQVDMDNPGTYRIHVKYFFKDYPFQVQIIDTIAPQLTLKSGEIYLAAGRSYEPDYFVKAAGDNSGRVETSFNGMDKLTFEAIGSQLVTVTAKDASENETSQTISVIVENAPQLAGIRDYFITPNAQPDFAEGVSALDVEDGELTDSIRIDTSKIDQSRDDIYSVYYEVTDSNGIMTSQEAKVTVCTAEELEQLVGNRSVDVLEKRVVGIPNFRDAGAGQNGDIQAEGEHILPALVYLKLHTSNTEGHGSGFIINITQDYVDICSNQHVLQYGGENFEVVFHGGEAVRGMEVLGADSEMDVGFARIRREAIPADIYDSMLSVHLNETLWNQIADDGRQMFMICLDENGQVDRTSRGELISWNSNIAPFHNEDLVETSVDIVIGNSGSPIFDANGNLLCMAMGNLYTPDANSRHMGVQFDDIVRLYREITGEELYMY